MQKQCNIFVFSLVCSPVVKSKFVFVFLNIIRTNKTWKIFQKDHLSFILSTANYINEYNMCVGVDDTCSLIEWVRPIRCTTSSIVMYVMRLSSLKAFVHKYNYCLVRPANVSAKLNIKEEITS